jgi:alpha-glucosidase
MLSRRSCVFRTARALPAVLALLVVSSAEGAGPQLYSPDHKTELRIELGERLSYSVLHDGQSLLQGATLSLDVDHVVLGLAPRLKASKATSVDGWVEPVVHQKAARLHENYNQLRLDFKGDYAVVFRAYDNGVAYRFETSLPRAEVKVYAETVALEFVGDHGVYYPQEESFFSHNERHFLHLRLKDLTPQMLASVPAIVEAEQGVKLAIADADVDDYPGLWLRGSGSGGLVGAFPPYPLEVAQPRDRDVKPTRSADYIAITKGTRTYPWRLIGIAEKDGDLLTSSLVYLLSKPSQVADTSWIRPGKVPWDWYNANNVYGVDFKSGVNTETYKYYIDFAARYGLEYVVLDEGWYKLGNLLEVSPQIDMELLSAYAREKGVGLILWVVWKTLDDQLDAALDRFERWGVKGIKVDFMQRDDQQIVNYYHKVSRAAARRKMLVDFHGAVRPASMTRTWPNLISTEGVMGNEQNKWSTNADPEHNVTIPFTRMFLGPMDYTPGAMRNASKRSFAPVFEEPMSLGTRAHELAKYVVYESPLQMLADTPSSYLREPEVMEFLGPVPTVWDESRVLAGQIGDYVLVARRHGREWYVGAMTDWTARELPLDLAFLPEGRFQMEAYADGPNADRHASDYRKSRSEITRVTQLKLALAEGGGWAARIRPLD